MDDVDDDPSPIALMLEGLIGFLDEVDERQQDGWAMVERMRVATPIEFYVRPDAARAGLVAAIESRMPPRTLTTVLPVLHELSVTVEVDGAEREPVVEP